MPFKMKCPKCGSQSYTIERDTRTYSGTRQGELVFACRCGKQLFGDQIDAEFQRQKAEWESDSEHARADRERDDRRREQDEREEQLRRAFEYRKAWVAQKRAEQEAARHATETARLHEWATSKGHSFQAPPPPPVPSVRMNAPRGAHAGEVRGEVRSHLAQPLSEQRKPLSPAPSVPPQREERPRIAITHVESCEWPGCTNPRAPNSKYCSRACSNKNARWRHAQRKKSEEAA